MEWNGIQIWLQNIIHQGLICNKLTLWFHFFCFPWPFFQFKWFSIKSQITYSIEENYNIVLQWGERRGECWHGNPSLLFRVTARGIFRSTKEDLLLRPGNLIKVHAQWKQVINWERAITWEVMNTHICYTRIVKVLPWVNRTPSSLCFQLVLL